LLSHDLRAFLADPLNIAAYPLDSVTPDYIRKDNNQSQHQKHFPYHLPRLSFPDRPIRQDPKIFEKNPIHAYSIIQYESCQL
jgi:hypothetical protein